MYSEAFRHILMQVAADSIKTLDKGCIANYAFLIVIGLFLPIDNSLTVNQTQYTMTS